MGEEAAGAGGVRVLIAAEFAGEAEAGFRGLAAGFSVAGGEECFGEGEVAKNGVARGRVHGEATPAVGLGGGVIALAGSDTGGGVEDAGREEGLFGCSLWDCFEGFLRELGGGFGIVQFQGGEGFQALRVGDANFEVAELAGEVDGVVGSQAGLREIALGEKEGGAFAGDGGGAVRGLFAGGDGGGGEEFSLGFIEASDFHGEGGRLYEEGGDFVFLVRGVHGAQQSVDKSDGFVVAAFDHVIIDTVGISRKVDRELGGGEEEDVELHSRRSIRRPNSPSVLGGQARRLGQLLREG